MKHYPSIEIDDLAAVIRESIAAHKNDDERIPVFDGTVENKAQSAPELKLQPEFQPHATDRYHVNDLLQYHDRAFLYAAYRAILKRHPDESEFLRDRKRMQGGQINKIDLLADLRFSPEGKAKNVELEGLTVPAFVRRLGRLPFLGYLINLAIAFFRLPNQVSDQRQFGAYLLAQNQQIAEFVNVVSARVAECRNGVSRLEDTISKQADLSDRLTGQHEAILRLQAAFDETRNLDQQLVILTTEIHKIDATQQDLQNRLEVNKDIFMARIENEVGRRLELRQLISEQQHSLATFQSKLQAEIEKLHRGVQHTRAELTLQRGSLDALDALGAPSQEASVLQKAESFETHQLDALYAALEDRFRGTREEIKERFRRYLPYVNEATGVIDLGCGRGEWLEILNEENIAARGVDRNRIQIEQCRALGLNVFENDFIAYLDSLENSSVGAITGFHIIEHVPIENLVKLLDQVMRVLRPGGVVIFETPNPENVLVGSNFFYLDPTHRRPLPSQLMEFLLQSRGFHPTEVLNLHPWDAGKVKEENELADRLNHYFYGPMDYAIIGWKVGP